MSFDKYTQTVTRLKRLNIELNYYPEEESESGAITAIYEGSDGKDIVIRKQMGDETDATDKLDITKLLKKIVKEAEKALWKNTKTYGNIF